MLIALRKVEEQQCSKARGREREEASEGKGRVEAKGWIGSMANRLVNGRHPFQLPKPFPHHFARHFARLFTTKGCVANMHLTCTNMDPTKVKEALADARKYGIRNIVALRGDAPAGDSEWKASEGGENGRGGERRTAKVKRQQKQHIACLHS